MAAQPLVLETLRDEAAWAALEPEWRALYAIAPGAAPPLRWEWQWLWWQVYGPVYGHGAQPLRIVCARLDGRLVGVLPLYLSRPRRTLGMPVLRPLSSGEEEFEETCAEYLGALIAPDMEAPVTAALSAHLHQQREFVLLDLPAVAGDALVSGLRDWWVRTESLGPCWQADLSNGVEPYLATLSRTTRQKARKFLRESFEPGYRFDLARTRDEALAIFEDLAALHQERWTAAGKAGCFAAPRFLDFHRRLVAALAAPGEVALARLIEDGRPISVHYGFPCRRVLQCYQTGAVLDGSTRLKSPGIAGWLRLAEELRPLGIDQLDYLLGANDFKQRMAVKGPELWRVRAARPGARTGLLRFADHLREKRRPSAPKAEEEPADEA
jgi:CelD/BcsL family acetyltransferase involved in cellulose biosynthesis